MSTLTAAAATASSVFDPSVCIGLYPSSVDITSANLLLCMFSDVSDFFAFVRHIEIYYWGCKSPQVYLVLRSSSTEEGGSPKGFGASEEGNEEMSGSCREHKKVTKEERSRCRKKNVQTEGERENI